jgi:hypothetical protein
VGPPPQSRWSDALFDALAHQCDPEADAVIAEHARLTGLDHPRHLVQSIARHLVLPPEDRSPPIQAYLDERPPHPAWADQAQLAAGASFFADYGSIIGGALFCASLPESYAGARGVRVLTLTTRLATDPVRRVYETAQMIVDALTPGGLDPATGRGYEDVRRVRLMHAVVRYLIEHDPAVPKVDEPGAYPSWCPSHGRPVNQEDLLGTLMSFTQVPFEVLDRVGIGHDPAGAAAYLHSWCVIAYHLGIDPDLLPLTLDDARTITAAIRRRQYRPSDDALVLGGALLGALEASVPRLGRRLPAAMIRWYVGSEIAAINGIPERRVLLVLLERSRVIMRRVSLLEHHDRFVLATTRWLTTALMNDFVEAGRGDRPPLSFPQFLGDEPGRRKRRWRI